MLSSLLRSVLLRAPPRLTEGEGEGKNRLTFLGTAGFVLETPDRVLVLDPYLSRAGLWKTAFGRLDIEPGVGTKIVPRADEVLVGHAHYDHSLDAPEICIRTGARLLGSRAVGMVGRAAGVPEKQIVEVKPHIDYGCGGCRVRGVPSIHGKAVLGRIPLPGDVLSPPDWPPRVTELRHGQVFLWHVEVGGVRILHVDSADYREEELAGYQADILLLCAVGRHYRPHYTERLLKITGARVVVPCHWDDFSVPLMATPRQLPGVDLGGFMGEIRGFGAEARLLGVLQSWRF